ncbi:hypothetical protein V6N13_026589 [Hibiscus sabdariffa]
MAFDRELQLWACRSFVFHRSGLLDTEYRADFICYLWGCKETWKGFSMLAFKDLWPVVKLSLSSGVMLNLSRTLVQGGVAT